VTRDWGGIKEASSGWERGKRNGDRGNSTRTQGTHSESGNVTYKGQKEKGNRLIPPEKDEKERGRTWEQPKKTREKRGGFVRDKLPLV